MTTSLNKESPPGQLPVDEPTKMALPPAEAAPVKVGAILDEEDGGFVLEYDNTCGQRNTMRLDARTYEDAILEARSFLGIQPDDHDADGSLWAVE
jgi:hypothetical protein